MNDIATMLAKAIEEARRSADSLAEENRLLRKEVEELREANKQCEKISDLYESRYLEVERQNGNLASLYIATYNLHSTLDFSELLRSLREIVVNLVGSESFGVYVRSTRTDAELELLAGEGIDLVAQRTVRVDGIVQTAIANKRVMFAEAHAPGFPLACVPLVIGDEAFGVIVIYGLLAHKTRFETTDVELLELLAQQAATAFYAARLHAKNDTRLKELFVLPEYALANAIERSS
jgi:hypothetical protein